MTLFPVPVQQVVMSYFLFCIAHGAEKLITFWKLFLVQPHVDEQMNTKFSYYCLIKKKKKKKDLRMTNASKNFSYEEIILLLEERTAPGWWDIKVYKN